MSWKKEIAGCYKSYSGTLLIERTVLDDGPEWKLFELEKRPSGDEFYTHREWINTFRTLRDAKEAAEHL